MPTPEECQFEIDRDRLVALANECMTAAETSLGLCFTKVFDEKAGLTQPHAFLDTLANQQRIHQRLYQNEQTAGYIIAATSEWRPIFTVISSLLDPQQFILSVRSLEGFDDAKAALIRVLSNICNS